jgi:hypothetical protein
MKVRALRGVCVGVDQHLKPGDTVDLDAASVSFLKSIGAVELVPDEPTKPISKPEPEPVKPAGVKEK